MADINIETVRPVISATVALPATETHESKSVGIAGSESFPSFNAEGGLPQARELSSDIVVRGKAGAILTDDETEVGPRSPHAKVSEVLETDENAAVNSMDSAVVALRTPRSQDTSDRSEEINVKRRHGCWRCTVLLTKPFAHYIDSQRTTYYLPITHNFTTNLSMRRPQNSEDLYSNVRGFVFRTFLFLIDFVPSASGFWGFRAGSEGIFRGLSSRRQRRQFNAVQCPLNPLL